MNGGRCFNKYMSRGGEEGRERGQREEHRSRGEEDGQKRHPAGLLFAVVYHHSGMTCQNERYLYPFCKIIVNQKSSLVSCIINGIT